MDSQIATCSQLFRISDSLLPRSLADLERAELLKPAGPDSRPILWLAAHVTQARCGLLNLAGKETEIPWEGRFGRGKTLDDADQYPEVADVLSRWKQTADSLRERFDALSDEELSATVPRDFPIPDKTLRGAIHFLAYHEAYHVGQMGYLRKWLGKESLVG